MWVSPSGSLRHSVTCIQKVLGGQTAYVIVPPVNGLRPVLYGFVDSSLTSGLCEIQVSSPDGGSFHPVASWFQLLEQSGPSETAVTPLTVPKFTLPFPLIGFTNGEIRLIYTPGGLTVFQVMATAAWGYCEPEDAVDPVIIDG